jgi:hypothetical protein
MMPPSLRKLCTTLGRTRYLQVDVFVPLSYVVFLIPPFSTFTYLYIHISTVKKEKIKAILKCHDITSSIKGAQLLF